MIAEENIYYKILKNGDNLSVVCLQWFDEYDYDQSKFLKDADGNDLEFKTEDEALDYINLLSESSIIEHCYSIMNALAVIENSDYISDDLKELSKNTSCEVEKIINYILNN